MKILSTCTRKEWGTTTRIFLNSRVQVDCIRVRGGGVCSKHLHKAKSNTFHVVSGRLLIDTWPGDLKETAYLYAGESFTVPSNTLHRFQTDTFTIAFEIYVVVPIQLDDIVREEKDNE